MAARRARRRERTRAEGIAQLPWRRLENPYAPVEILGEDQIEAIHLASMRVLEETGMEVLGDAALDAYAAGGADVDRANRRVRLDRDLIAETVAKAPAEFTLHARNPERSVVIGGRHMGFCNATTPPFCTDLDGGRRMGNAEDFKTLVKLLQVLNVVHFFYGYPVEPQDMPPETRHLDCYFLLATLSDKCWRAYSQDRRQALDAIEMTRIARGVSSHTMAAEPALFLNVNTNSPLRLDGPQSDGLIEFARMGQPVTLTAFTMAGAMAPATVAGALVLQNAEVLSGIALAQMVNPGTPAIYGAFTSNVHMRSGSLALGTPEFTQASLASGQLARRYRLPLRLCNANSSPTVDAQAAYESGMSLWGAVMGHGNIVSHGVGWLESGLSFSYEKAMIDAEMLQMMARVLTPPVVDADTLAVDAIAEVGPGGHFFGAAHTLERFQTAFYEPLLSDWRPFDTWTEDGAKTATQRANALWKKLLNEYEEPPMDPAVREELVAYVRRRKDEIAKG
jgi:trimethylamine---corrinoid protein Co-methyltransferase